MDITFQDRPLFLNPTIGAWLKGTLTPVPGGFVVTRPEGTVLSVQPNGDYQPRPAGTAGAYEVCTVDPKLNVLHFAPNGVRYAVVFRGV